MSETPQPVATRRLPAGLARRLAQAHRRGWLVRLYLASCQGVDGWPEAIDAAAGICALQHPGRLQPRLEFDFADICDVELHAVVFRHDGVRIASAALVAPWRTGQPVDHLVADLLQGMVVPGRTVEARMPGGVRRTAVVLDVAGERATARLA